MRLMIASALALAGLAIGIQCCPPLKAHISCVIFGTEGKAPTTVPGDQLVARAADTVKEGAASALHCVAAAAGQLTGRKPDPKPAAATDAPDGTPADAADPGDGPAGPDPKQKN